MNIYTSLYFLFFSVIGYEFIVFFQPMVEPCLPIEDIALVEIQIHYARLFQEFTGVYSRYEFQHPGPIQFYWNAATELLSPFTQNILGKHQFSNWLLNKFFLILGFHYFLQSVQKTTRGWFFGLVFVVLYCQLFYSGMREINYTVWNPANTIGPSFFLIFSFTSLLRGQWGALLVLPIATQFAFQNHLGTVVLFAPFTVYAFFRFYRDNTIPFGKLIAYGMYYLVISTVLFFPSLYFEIWQDGGNLTKILKFISENGGIKKNLWKTLTFIGSLYTGVFSHQTDTAKNISGGLLLLLLVIVSVHRFRDAVWKEWKITYLCGFGLTLYASLGMRGPQLEFSIWFYYPLAFLSVILVTVSIHNWILQIFPTIFDSKIAKLVPVIPLLMIAALARPIQAQPTCDESFRSATSELSKILRNQATRVRFHLPFNDTHGDQWLHFAGIANQLNQQGIEFCVNPEWDFLFSRNLHCKRWSSPSTVLDIDVRNNSKYHLSSERREDWKWVYPIGAMDLLSREDLK